MMPKKFDKDIFELDLYEILNLRLNADDNAIKKSYRKKALSCHPDKNPDNPNAADQFNKLKKYLEILLDPGARAAYDKVLKGRKAAAVRARETNAKTRELKAKLEERERAAQNLQKVNIKLSEEERFRRELKRLEEEGERIIEEELERVNKMAKEDVHQSLAKEEEPHSRHETFRVKAVWRPTQDWKGYTEEEIRQLFYKWGEINAIVIKQKESKGTALIEFKQASGADMAIKFEKGMIGKPLEVFHSSPSGPKDKASNKKREMQKTGQLKSSHDFESISTMNQRRLDERRKLIEALMKEEQL